MTNPYSILGLDPSASEDAVREAYRRLAVKYSTEDYADGSLRDIAATKLAELDAAFDQIMSERKLGSNRQSASNGQTRYQTASDSTPFSNVRALLQRGDYTRAEQLLLAVSPSARDAEWNFLMGHVCRAKGWLDDAARYYDAACSAAPGNREYTAAYNQIEQQRTTGQSGSYAPYTTSNERIDPCSAFCQALCCLSICNTCCCSR